MHRFSNIWQVHYVYDIKKYPSTCKASGRPKRFPCCSRSNSRSLFISPKWPPLINCIASAIIFWATNLKMFFQKLKYHPERRPQFNHKYHKQQKLCQRQIFQFIEFDHSIGKTFVVFVFHKNKTTFTYNIAGTQKGTYKISRKTFAVCIQKIHSSFLPHSLW